jgi:single-strand DNA-binding protein
VAETTLTVSVEQVEGDSTTVTVICHGELAENVCLSLVRHARIVASGRLLVTSRSPEDVHPVRQFELLADEIGASLCFATADVHKVSRAGVQS